MIPPFRLGIILTEYQRKFNPKDEKPSSGDSSVFSKVGTVHRAQ